MRIVNAMIHGNAMTNLHRNVRHVNNLVNQIETTKRFQRPSDDPISAARALRYRTTIAETQRFISNINGGLSWMHVTESAFMNMTTEVLQRFNQLLVHGATGHLTFEDRQGIAKEMQELIDQIKFEMNQTYMGRHVFSGFRTHMPPIFTSDNDKSFVITQQFNAQDIERILSFQKILNDPTHNSNAHKAVVHTAHVIKLAYNHVTFDFSVFDDDGNALRTPGFNCPAGNVFNIVVRSFFDGDAYTPPYTSPPTDGSPGTFTVHFIPETGELVLCEGAVRAFQDGTTITYHREGFRKGELNPWIYFDVVEVLGRTELDVAQSFADPFVNPDGSFNFYVTITGDDAIDPPGEGTFNMIGDGAPMISINGDTPTSIWDLNGPHSHIFSVDTWETTWSTTPDINVIQRVTAIEDGFMVDISVVNYDGAPIDFELTQLFAPSAPDLNIVTTAPDIPQGVGTAIWTGSVSPDGSTLSSFTIRSPLPDAPLLPGEVVYQGDDWIVHEISVANHQRINDLARHSYTDKMYTDMKRLLAFTNSIQVSERTSLIAYFQAPPHSLTGEELQHAVETQLSDERRQANYVMQDRFNTMLQLMTRHNDGVIAEHARLGSRMDMFTMMDVRLSEEEIQMEELLANTADTNMGEAIMRKNATEAVMAAALRAIAMTTQLSLVNFLR